MLCVAEVFRQFSEKLQAQLHTVLALNATTHPVVPGSKTQPKAESSAMTSISRRSLLSIFSASILLQAPALAHDDKEHIVHLMKSMFDTPENPLSVDPIIVLGDNAIAGWVQGDKGGRALLWRVNGEWQIRLCSGDALKDPAMLVEAKISADDAKSLVEQLLAAESKLDPAVVAKFSTFEGTVMMDGTAGHSGHKHGATQSQ